MSAPLFAALLLPWLAGIIALKPLYAPLGLTTAGWLGYGYFFGATLLALSAVIAGRLPGESVFTTTLCLAALTLAMWFGAIRAAPLLRPATPVTPLNRIRGELWITALLLGLIALHLGFAVNELFWRPVYPWDAWQTWLYIGKAWFYSGTAVDMLPAARSLSAAQANAYTVEGHHYPWLLPAQSYWLASVLGVWQENRVTWPALPAGVALALAVWGQAVATTGRRMAGPLAAWLLLSLPLLQTHISLAGYADLWLAGFSGLGLVAVARGLLEAHTGQVLLGIAALVLGLLVKHEAIIWLFCGLTLICLVRRPGLTTVLLVLLGGVAVSLLALTLLRFEVQWHPVFSNYWPHLWLADSWHLLWYLLPAALLLALRPGSPIWAEGRILGLLLGGLLASQLFLFGATSAGAWAEDGTAAQRLLLQITPVLVFALAGLLGSRSLTRARAPEKGQWRQSSVLLAVLAGPLCLLLVASAVLLPGTSQKDAPSYLFSAPQLRLIEGPARRLGNRLELPEAQTGHAILSTGPIRVQAESVDLVSVDLTGAHLRHQTLFWRAAANPDALVSRSLPVGSGRRFLRDDPDWHGEIIEAGLVLYPNATAPLSLGSLRLEAATPATLLRLVVNDWFTPVFWTQASINRTYLGAPSPLMSLPVLAGLWVLFTGITLSLLSGARPTQAPLLAVAALAWLLLDLRWLHNSYHQAHLTRMHYANASDDQRDALDLGDDAALVTLAREARAALGQEHAKVLVMAEGDDQRFALRRLKYALLPHAAYLHNGRVPRRLADAMDAMVLLSDTGDAYAAGCSSRLQRLGFQTALTTARGTLCMRQPNRSAQRRASKESIL